MKQETEITIDFAKFPWFAGDRHPVPVSGKAQCRLTRISPTTSLGDPVRVSWIVTRVEFTVGLDKHQIIDFNGNTSDKEDFTRWLGGQYGLRIANELRETHLRLSDGAPLGAKEKRQ